MCLVCGEQPDVQPVFEQRGAEIAARLRAHGLLREGARMLDIGCGCGRIARHLVAAPGLAGYVGFDRHPGMIDWCHEHIARRDSRFSFLYLELRSIYTLVDGHAGTLSPESFRFPFEDASFEGALAASVFTHIPIAETAQYLRELRRVLTDDGTALVTAFIATDDRHAVIDDINFIYPRADLLAAIDDAGLVCQPLEGRPGSSQSWFALSRR